MFFSIRSRGDFRASSAPLIPNPFPELCSPTHSPVLNTSLGSREEASDSSTHVRPTGWFIVWTSINLWQTDREPPAAVSVLNSHNRWQVYDMPACGEKQDDVFAHTCTWEVHSRVSKTTRPAFFGAQTSPDAKRNEVYLFVKFVYLFICRSCSVFLIFWVCLCVCRFWGCMGTVHTVVRS